MAADGDGFTDLEFTSLAYAIQKAVKRLNFEGKTLDEAYGMIYTAIAQESPRVEVKEIFRGPFKNLRYRMSDRKWSQFMTLFRRYAFTPAEFEKISLDEIGELKLAQAEMGASIRAMQELSDQSEQVAERLSKIKHELDQIQGE